MQGSIANRKAVRASVKRGNCDKMNETSAQIFIWYVSSFCDTKLGWCDTSRTTWHYAPNWPTPIQNGDF